VNDSDLLACLRAEHPAFRTGADLDRIDPGLLSRGERVDLLVVLEEQRRWFEAAQLRVLAVMQERDSSERGWAQESVTRMPSRPRPPTVLIATRQATVERCDEATGTPTSSVPALPPS
jgi:hypothetical protein